MKLRHTDEWIGLLVIAAIAVLIVAIMQAGLLRDWFKPVSSLRLILPESGVAGLEVGASVEVLGTRAGTIRKIVIDPSQQMYALADIDEQAKPFIRRDSTAVIRRQFGLAGAAFVDISRGSQTEMDWTYAVLNATAERAPTDSISALIDEVRSKVFPILDNVGQATKSLADVMDRVNKGEGNIGHLLKDETLSQQIEATVTSAHQSVEGLNEILGQLQLTAKQVNGITQGVGKDVPALLKKTDDALVNLQNVMKDLSQATTRLPAITRNVEGSTANLPTLLTQTQLTAQQLEELLTQLRGLWLLGGGNNPPPPVDTQRLPPSAVQP
ncbi:MAG TPA: MlaD family protein [Terriglobales bacterium]|nr:MlaD family protein [Terriglobales bacterium]